jgi:hypothetical protein
MNPSPDLLPPADARALTAWATPPVLRSEDKTDFARLLDAFVRDVEPCGVSEETYVADIACLVWEMLRLRRYRTTLINGAFRDAVLAVAERMMDHSGQPATSERRQRALDLAQRWFHDGQARHDVATLLARFDLDESTIETEAMRRLKDQLDAIEKRQAALEARRDKAFGCIAAFRTNFGRKVRDTADRFLDGEPGRLADIAKLLPAIPANPG